ncbi:MAG: M50 family metallopeptidase [Candidatus Thermoplasmatota archaeon]
MNEKKVYKDFKDIPPREYMYFPKGTVEPSKLGSFSLQEIQQLTISIVVLSTAFTFALTGNNLLTGLNEGFNLSKLPIGFVMCLTGVITAFFFHEIAHKIVAQRHMLWSEYRWYPKGLSAALLLGLLTPIVFASPGAVMFRGGSRTHETGQIAMAGPLANILTAGVTLFLYLFVFVEDTLLGQITGFICFINTVIAFFNLLPLGPLDGIKIIKWNPTVWAIMLIVSTGFLMVVWPKIFTITL